MKSLSKSLVVVFLTLCLALIAVAKVKRYEVILPSTVQTGHTQLKPGTYELEVEGGMATFFLKNKEVCKVAVRTEETPKKIDASSVEISGEKLVAIEVGHTSMKLIVSE